MIREFRGPYRFLSNFYPCEIWYDGMKFKTVEHAYQAAKTNDHKKKLMIQSAETPGEAKRFGRYIKLRPDWEEVKVVIMGQLLRYKFSNHNPSLLKRLIETGDESLQEGNLWGDTFWGVDLRTGKGDNVLGILLMEVRKSL